MLILGIETSCDDTSVALYCERRGIIGQSSMGQTDIHSKYGGVVPELASREHQNNLKNLIRDLLNQTNTTIPQLSRIACTMGPGLIGSLMVGWQFAKALSCFNKIPLVGVNHLEAHILTILLDSKQKLHFPFLALLVSGGHTQLVLVMKAGQYQLISSTRDDACGEAFDKGATLLGLGYPGGPLIAKLAEQYDAVNHPIPPMKFKIPFYSKGKHTDRNHYDFSFSGLKTQLSLLMSGNQGTHLSKAEIAYSYQQAIVSSLVNTTVRANQKYKCKSIVLAGGVSCNLKLRADIRSAVSHNRVKVHCSPPSLCTDNGAMIAHLGYIRRNDAQLLTASTLESQPKASWPLTELEPPK